MRRRFFLAASTAIATAPFLAEPTLANGSQITGAGASLPRPVYEKWAQLAREAIGVQVSYQPVGSGAGGDEIAARRVDFAGSDAPKRAAFLREQRLIQFPAVVGTVVVFANLPGVQADQLRLTGETAADLFLGNIKRWNDPRLAAVNGGLRLPDLPVTPVHRAGSSGTTFIFTTYLARVSDAWRDGPRAGSTVQWPAGESAEGGGNGVIAKVKATPGAIGYAEASSVKANQLATTMLRNRTGGFVKPDAASFAKAAAAGDWTPANFLVDMVDLEVEGAWPIVSPTFVLMPTDPAAEKVAASRNTMKLFDWAFRNAAAATTEAGFASIPASVHAAVYDTWRKVKGPDGQPIWEA